jgi:hypothetical protein
MVENFAKNVGRQREQRSKNSRKKNSPLKTHFFRLLLLLSSVKFLEV